jgi:hypothetical protein
MDVESILVSYLEAWKARKRGEMVRYAQPSWAKSVKMSPFKYMRDTHKDIMLLDYGNIRETKNVNNILYTFAVDVTLRIQHGKKAVIKHRTLNPNVIIEGDGCGVNPISMFRGLT